MLAQLRFSPELEREFRREHEARAPFVRMTLQILSALLVAATPLYDGRLLHAPAGFLAASRLLQFGVEIPLVLLSLLFTAWTPLRPLSARATTLAAVAMAVCLMTQRVIGARYDFEVPHEFPAITFTAVLFLGQLRLFYFLPWAALTMLGTTVVEFDTFPDGNAIYGVISSWMLFTIAATGAYTLEFSARQSWYRGRLLTFQASRDALTGLPNRRHFDLKLHELVRDAARQRKNVALLMIDIDFFKAFNDHFGHPIGDECLRRVGARLTMAMRRPQDFCARVGGEEFAAVWFDAGADDAVRLAEALRQSIEELGIPNAPGYGTRVSGSGGFVQVLAPSPADSAERICAEMIKAADDALYAAKHAGRGRMIVARPATPAFAAPASAD
ncbi:MAG: hypothetical protein NVS9B10_14510 [Nevskia sp.]